MAKKKKIPDVKTDDIEMSAKDFPSASRRTDLTPPPATPEVPPREEPQSPTIPRPLPAAASEAPASTTESHSAALVFGAAVVACIAAVISVVAPALYGFSGGEEPMQVFASSSASATGPVAAAPADTTSQLLSLTILDLGRVLETARPYENEIRAVRAFGADDADVMAFVDSLEPYAATGVVTLADIQAAMPSFAAEIRAAIEAGEQSWTKRTAASLRSILTFWRPADTLVDKSAQAALATAQNELAGGRIKGAIAALGELEAAAWEAAAPLLEEMGRRLAVDRSAGALTELALNRLAGGD